MKSISLTAPEPIENHPLLLVDVPEPRPSGHNIRLRISACGLCHTDLHVVEGDLKLPKLPLTPGHQIIGVVDEMGPDVKRFAKGDRVGIPWLNSTCGWCEFCTSGRENLCDNIQFTGYHVDGGYAENVIVHEDFAYHIPGIFSDISAAPLLCAGVIGFRALRLSEIQNGQRMGLYGFGASAHIAIQILKHWGCEISVFTRTPHHRELADALGAAWTGTADDTPPWPIDSAVIFAPAGQLVHSALRVLKKGGTLVLAGIHMTPIPEMEYRLIYEERAIRSVANSTRDDVTALLRVAAEIPVRTEVETFPLKEANDALHRLKMSEIRGSGVLEVSTR